MHHVSCVRVRSVWLAFRVVGTIRYSLLMHCLLYRLFKYARSRPNLFKLEAYTIYHSCSFSEILVY